MREALSDSIFQAGVMRTGASDGGGVGGRASWKRKARVGREAWRVARERLYSPGLEVVVSRDGLGATRSRVGKLVRRISLLVGVGGAISDSAIAGGL